MNLRNGSTLQGGKYKIIRLISSGGFGITYEAEHVMLQKRVAIKEFFVKDFCNRDEATSRVTVGTQNKVALVAKLKKKFIEEAIAISRLDHPNIVKVTDVFEDNGTAYYVMDYIDGPSLADMVKHDGKLPEKKALKYILQVSDALKYVHSNNRLHLDIKPGNIMVDSNDNAILIDFGASKQYDEESGENTSTLLGKTPGYAPIEQMGNTVQKFTPATDIYALGATLYKLVTGITPPEATQLASGEELPKIGDGVSEGIKSAITTAIQINKSKRPQNVETFVSILHSSLKQEINKNLARTTNSRTNINKTVPNDEETLVAPENIKKEAVNQHTVQTEQSKREPSVTQNAQPKAIQIQKKEGKGHGVKIFLGAFAIIAILVIPLIIFDPNRGQNYYTEPSNASTVPYGSIAIDSLGESAPYYTNSKGIGFGYVGEWANDMPNGQGTGYYNNGTYNGPYVDGLRSGENCTFNTSDGMNTYVGSFADDEYNHGVLTLNTGEYFEGDFYNGQPYNGTWYNADGSFNSDVKDGK